jgi:hypothetical protein
MASYVEVSESGNSFPGGSTVVTIEGKDIGFFNVDGGSAPWLIPANGQCMRADTIVWNWDASSHNGNDPTRHRMVIVQGSRVRLEVDCLSVRDSGVNFISKKVRACAGLVIKF